MPQSDEELKDTVVNAIRCQSHREIREIINGATVSLQSAARRQVARELIRAMASADRTLFVAELVLEYLPTLAARPATDAEGGGEAAGG